MQRECLYVFYKPDLTTCESRISRTASRHLDNHIPTLWQLPECVVGVCSPSIIPSELAPFPPHLTDNLQSLTYHPGDRPQRPPTHSPNRTSSMAVNRKSQRLVTICTMEA